MYRVFLSVVIILVSISTAFAQQLTIPDNRNKRAVKHYEKGMEALNGRAPMEAIDHFSKALDKDEAFVEARIMRGSVYYNLNDFANAETDFDAVVHSGQEFPVKVYYTLGFIYWKQDKFQEAYENFDRFLLLDGGDSRMTLKAERYRDQSKFAAYAVAHPLPFDPVSVGDKINTDVNEYLPSITADGKTMLFTRRVGRYEFLYYSDYINGEWTEPQSVDIVNQYMEAGAHSISADGKLIVFTSCEREDGYGSCDLYYTHRRHGNWIPPRNLGTRVNSAAWDSQPSLADNGRTIYFSSNRQGTIGSKDLWVTRRLPNGRWSFPINLGPDINTTGDEQAPFIHFDGSTLYFMSNEHIGMGDFDLFKTTRVSDTIWTTPVNLGYPINTKFHDGTLSINVAGNRGFITSDRHHSKELQKDNKTGSETDIYSFEVPVEIRPNPSTYVVFHVTDQLSGDPLIARINVLNREDEVIFRGETDDEGDMLVVLPLDNDYGIQVASDGYAFFSERISPDSTYTLDKPLIYDVALAQPEALEEEPIVLKNILFEFGSDELKPTSRTEIEHLQEFLMQNPEVFIEIRGHTDDVGQPEDNLALSQARADRVKEALVQKGIDPERISTRGFGETQPIADNDTEQGRQLNRRTEFLIIKK